MAIYIICSNEVLLEGRAYMILYAYMGAKGPIQL